jgi:predicted ribosome quality control (RQC) complex YloA/Tae2 family protein
LVFGYDVPDEPSRIRVRLWRQLKGLGAIYPEMSFCVLPDSKGIRSRLESLTSGLQELGPYLVLEAKGMDKRDNNTLSELFKEDLEKEYRELIEECNEFLEEIRRNVATGNVTQTEVSELEEAIDALGRWFAKIRGKDFLRSSAQERIVKLIVRCRQALLAFSEKAQRNTLKRR